MKKIISVMLMTAVLTACSTTNNGNDDSVNNKQPLKQAAPINVQLGLAYLQQGQVTRAKEKLLLALQQDPDSIAALDAMGYFWEVTDNNTLADKYYKKALIKHPTSGQALNNYGTYLCRIKQYRAAEKYLLAAANDAAYINSAAAMENAGLCELGIPNMPQAEVYFKKALQQDPGRATSYYELARINYMHSNYKQAKEYLDGYRKVGAMSAASLWLGIKIANKTKDVATVLKNGALLEKHFPNTPEYKLYQKMQLS